MPLSAVLSSLSSAALTNHLTTLRRDLTNHVIGQVLDQPMAVVDLAHTLSISPSSPSTEIISGRLENLAHVLNFLSEHLLSILPPSEGLTFPQSLCKPVTTSILNKLLIPSLPSSFDLLPPFLELVQHAVAFEEQYVIDLLKDDPHDRPVKAWANGVGGHYERQRRLQILEMSRHILTIPEDLKDTFIVHIDAPVEVRQPQVVPIQVDDDVKDDEWGFDDSSDSVESGKTVNTVENGWGFDDDMNTDPISAPLDPPVDSEQPPSITEPDPSDAWGWDEDVPSEPAENSNNGSPAPLALEDDIWDDDPWANPPSMPNSSSQPHPSSPPATPPAASPRVAMRLEKLANKGKKNLNGHSLTNSPVVSSPLSPHKNHLSPMSPFKPPSSPALPSTATSSVASAKSRPPKLVPPAPPKESYLVSSRMKEILAIVENVLNEGIQFSSSRIIPTSEGDLSPGTLLLQSAPSVLDLYRALYPVVFGSQLQSSMQAPIRFSNNCLYLSQEVEKLENRSTLVKDRLSECRHRLRVLSDSWLDDAIVSTRNKCVFGDRY